MTDADWRARAERVLLRPVPPLLRERPELWSRCPWYFTDASGVRLRAIDGREYIDLEMGRGPNILGYKHPVTEAARTGFQFGTARTALYHPAEVELAEILVDVIPCAENVLFAKNGSDATTVAVRMARVATGRDAILSSGYHGFGDWCVADSEDVLGFPSGCKGFFKNIALNDLDGLRAAFEMHRGRVAALIVEPAHRVVPALGFLEACRALANEHGAVLIFDEVVTAFRLALGGAQEFFGVVPDLACLGKAMANGMSVSGVAGRRDLMLAIEGSFFSMTFGHDNPVFAVGKACLTYLCETGALVSIAAKGEQLRQAFDAAARKNGLPARAIGIAPRLDLEFPEAGRLNPNTQFCLFGETLLEHGILPTANIFACEMLGDQDIVQASAAFEAGMERIAQQL
jgi:glutamate-1-semialdehyde aminotransferase